MHVAVDGIIYNEKEQAVLLIKRRNPPYQDKWALPGGMVDSGETVEEALIREMKEETNLDVIPTSILGVYSDPQRDPRGQVISIVFVTSWNHDQSARAQDDAKEITWIPLSKLNQQLLAFDHYKILNDFKKWLTNNCLTFWSNSPRNTLT